MNKIVSIVIQVIVALIVFIILNNLAVYIMKQEDVIDDPTKLVATKLFTGWVETASFTDKAFNIHNPFALNYRKMPHSVNRMGGAQFSYTMWIKLNDVSASNTADHILFLQGDQQQYNYHTSQVKSSGFSSDNIEKDHLDYLVKCPLVKFGDSADNLIVEFNTTRDISARAEINRIKSADETIRHNVFSLMPGNWSLMTFIFEDDRRYNEHEDGVIFTFYLNNVLYHTQRYKGALRLNKGDLHILPTGTSQSPMTGGYLDDLTYYNYALNLNDINKLVTAGITNSRYNEMEGDPSFNTPLYLNMYNKLEISNA